MANFSNEDQASKLGQLDGRVSGLEKDMRSLANTVERVTQSMERGFHDTREMIGKSHRELQQDIRELSKSGENARKTNWGAISVIVAGLVTVLAWMQRADTEPIRTDVATMKAAMVEHKDELKTEIDELRNKEYSDATRIAALEAWDSARKLWKDSK